MARSGSDGDYVLGSDERKARLALSKTADNAGVRCKQFLDGDACGCITLDSRRPIYTERLDDISVTEMSRQPLLQVIGVLAATRSEKVDALMG